MNSQSECSCKSIVFLASGLLPLLLSGCGRPEQTMLQGNPTTSANLSKEELRQALDNYEEYSIAVIRETTSQIDRRKPDFRTRKMNLIQRNRLRQAFNVMLEQDEPIVALIDTWALTVKIKDYLKTGEGAVLFPENQSLVLEMAERLNSEIERIAMVALAGDVFEHTRAKVYSFAGSNPIKGIYSDTIAFATIVKPGQPGLFQEAIALPMTPFKAIGGVDRTASAIYNLSDSADRAAKVIQELPEAVRWQVLLLLLEMEETDMVQTLLANTSTISENSTAFVDSLDALPEQIKQQLSELIEELDKKQANLQTTLEKTEKTSAAIEKTLVQADKTAASFQKLSANINDAAASWEKAAQATENAFGGIEKLKATPADPNTPQQRPFDVIDYKETAEAVTHSASEINQLAENIRRILESEQLKHAYLIPSRTINLAAIRIAQLVVLVFLLSLLYRLFSIRFVNKRK